MEQTRTHSISRKILSIVGLIIFNLGMMMLIGVLTLDSFANQNSRLGGYVISFLLPYLIVLKTPDLTTKSRLLKYGSGFILYVMLILIRVDIIHALKSGVLPCLLISIAVLVLSPKLNRSNK